MRQDEQVTPAILLARMPQQTEVRAQDDDWTGRTDAKARRKLQNRLNQRIWRKRPHEEVTLLGANLVKNATLRVGIFQEVDGGKNEKH
jgi:hypothetical protein